MWHLSQMEVSHQRFVQEIMQSWHIENLAKAKEFFDVVSSTANTQIATMCLAMGQASGEFGTDHPHADQTVLVLRGEGTARVGDNQFTLVEGAVLLIEAGEPHLLRGQSDEGF